MHKMEHSKHPKGHHGKKGGGGGIRRRRGDLYLFAPDVLGDDLPGAAREVEVDEVGEQSHGSDEKLVGRSPEKGRARTSRRMAGPRVSVIDPCVLSPRL
jgi:hypothetical protein